MGSVLSGDDTAGPFSDSGFYYSSSQSKRHRPSNASSLINNSQLHRSNSTPSVGLHSLEIPLK